MAWKCLCSFSTYNPDHSKEALNIDLIALSEIPWSLLLCSMQQVIIIIICTFLDFYVDTYVVLSWYLIREGIPSLIL